MAYDPCGKQIPPLSKYCPDCGNRDAKVPRPAVPRADAAETRFRILHPNPMMRQQGGSLLVCTEGTNLEKPADSIPDSGCFGGCHLVFSSIRMG